MRRLRRIAFATAFFPLMVAIDSWLFRKWFRTSYFDWYIANGAFISVTASLFAVVWKNLNENRGLIAADPRLFLSANLELIGIQGQVIGHQLSEGGARLQANTSLSATLDSPRSGGVPFSDLFDGAASLVAALAMVSVDRPVVELPGLNEIEKWEGNLVAAPVSMTNAVAALILLVIKVARS